MVLRRPEVDAGLAEQSEEAAKQVESAVLQTRARGKRHESWLQAALIAGLLGIPAIGVAQSAQAPAKPGQSTTPQAATTPAADAAQPAKDGGATSVVLPPAGAQANTGEAQSKDAAHYIIGPEDALQVTVWKEPTLSGTFPVRPDGMISLVLVGDLPAAGRTPMQLSDDISLRLKKYLQDPSVTVLVMAVNSQRIYMIGEVGHVGPIPLAAGMSPLQAIAAAGGLSPFANSKKIYILRGEAGKQQKIPFNYKQALKGDSTQDIKLQPGDTIVIP
ncbi:MAG TPA: polysaccharide biosynthesis/export family protein [Edaphobacter sp.]|nr:polysaccharide biosynthesis/export family protein [Edaphobacter sp.]